MAIKVSGTVVIDNDRNANCGVITATSMDITPAPITFSPTDGSTGNAIGDNIVITYNSSLSKGTGNITLKSGSASGSTIETIAVSSGNVSVSNAQVTINPSSDLPRGTDVFVVIDDEAFKHSNTALTGGTKPLTTYNFVTEGTGVTGFSPSDGATGVAVDSNIVLTFNENIAKNTGASKNITIRSVSASGTVQQTISVDNAAVSVSGTQATINPPSNLAFETDTYIVVDADSFRISGIDDENSGNAVINTYNFTTAPNVPPLGSAHEGGYLICCSSSVLWIVAPSSTEVQRTWYNRNDAVTTANANASCGDWFIPNRAQLTNPGFNCRTYWDNHSTILYWSSSEYNSQHACHVRFTTGGSSYAGKQHTHRARAFRQVSY
jgi:methionine-rich copper-binding protein CopC